MRWGSRSSGDSGSRKACCSRRRPALRRTTNEYYHGNPAVEFVYIGGPYGQSHPATRPARRKVFVCNPKNAGGEEPCASKILSTLATRAYRRPAH